MKRIPTDLPDQTGARSGGPAVLEPECPGVVPRVDAILAEMDAREWRQEEAERYAHPAERPARNQPN